MFNNWIIYPLPKTEYGNSTNKNKKYEKKEESWIYDSRLHVGVWSVCLFFKK